MDRYISYPEADLNCRFKWLGDLIYRMDFEIRMMEEQGIGLRENLDWESSAKGLRKNIEKMKETLAQFEIEEGCFLNHWTDKEEIIKTFMEDIQPESLPLYINHKNELIRKIATEALKRKTQV